MTPKTNQTQQTTQTPNQIVVSIKGTTSAGRIDLEIPVARFTVLTGEPRSGKTLVLHCVRMHAINSRKLGTGVDCTVSHARQYYAYYDVYDFDEQELDVDRLHEAVDAYMRVYETLRHTAEQSGLHFDVPVVPQLAYRADLPVKWYLSWKDPMTKWYVAHELADYAKHIMYAYAARTSGTPRYVLIDYKPISPITDLFFGYYAAQMVKRSSLFNAAIATTSIDFIRGVIAAGVDSTAVYYMYRRRVDDKYMLEVNNVEIRVKQIDLADMTPSHNDAMTLSLLLRGNVAGGGRKA